MYAVANTPAGLMEFVRSYDSVSFGLPSIVGGSAPASPFSGPAQRLLVLRPACSPGRLCDPLHQRLQQSRCLHCCSDCYRVERTSSRAGIPPLWTSAFHGAPDPRLDAGSETIRHAPRWRGRATSDALGELSIGSGGQRDCTPQRSLRTDGDITCYVADH